MVQTQCFADMLLVGGTMSDRHAVSEQTCVVVLLILGLILFLLPEVSPVLADSMGDTPLLGCQGGAHHAVHGPPAGHVQAATQPALVLLQQPIMGQNFSVRPKPIMS